MCIQDQRRAIARGSLGLRPGARIPLRPQHFAAHRRPARAIWISDRGRLGHSDQDRAPNPGFALSMYGGSFNWLQPSFEYGGRQGPVDWFLAGDYLGNDRGIENPAATFNAIHDSTQQFHGFSYMSGIIDPNTRVNRSGVLSTDAFKFPIIQPESVSWPQRAWHDVISRRMAALTGFHPQLWLGFRWGERVYQRKSSKPARKCGVEGNRIDDGPCRLFALFRTAAFRTRRADRDRPLQQHDGRPPRSTGRQRQGGAVELFRCRDQPDHRSRPHRWSPPDHPVRVQLRQSPYRRAEFTLSYDQGPWSIYGNAAYSCGVGTDIISSQFNVGTDELAYIAQQTFISTMIRHGPRRREQPTRSTRVRNTKPAGRWISWRKAGFVPSTPTVPNGASLPEYATVNTSIV
jgi:hypothetical protein